MNEPVKLRDYLKSDAAKQAKSLNDKLHSAINGEWCSICGYVQELPGQRHECKGVVVATGR
jgi:uncharacterized Rossmann fold enzyme